MNGQTILTITGSDGSGGSGVQADIRLIHQMGGWAVSAVTCITVQNTLGIQEFYDLPADVVRRQVEALVNDLGPQVVKVGLLRRIDTVEAVADVLRHHRPRHVVYAPVLLSARGDRLIDDDVYEAIRRLIVPLCTVVLEPSVLPDAPLGQHGQANRLASAVAVYLSQGQTAAEALAHARAYLSKLPEAAGPNSRSDQLYQQFLEAVERFYFRYADVTFYAEELNVSARYLGQVTRRMGGRSPKAVIDGRIIQEVCRLLRTTPLPLKEIARRLGFSSQAHLSRFFRKQKGMSPSAYRQG